MLSDISPGGWLIVVSFMALGFGLMRLLVASMKGKLESPAPKQEKTFEDQTGFEGRSEETDSSARHTHDASSESGQTDQDWHQVLGVTPNASLDQIRAAYRKKMALYHPDKVSALGPEFSVLAERITKEINAAYERAISNRS